MYGLGLTRTLLSRTDAPACICMQSLHIWVGDWCGDLNDPRDSLRPQA